MSNSKHREHSQCASKGSYFQEDTFLMQTKRDRNRERNNLFMSKQRDFVAAQVKSQGKKRKDAKDYHFIVYIIQKAEKEGFEILWGWDRKPILAHF